MLIVVKVGGSILEEVPAELVTDIKNVLSDHQLVLVHGGGKGVTAIASKLGKEQQFVFSPKGFRSRYTDKETMDIFTMVMSGKIVSLGMVGRHGGLAVTLENLIETIAGLMVASLGLLFLAAVI